jgi:uncharacterized membrane protein
LGEQLFSAGYWKTLVYALVLMVVILSLPGGLMSLVDRVRDKWLSKPGG